MNPISKQFSSIEQVTGQYLKQKNVTSPSKTSDVSFEDVLRQQQQLKFSKHASQRLESRNISKSTINEDFFESFSFSSMSKNVFAYVIPTFGRGFILLSLPWGIRWLSSRRVPWCRPCGRQAFRQSSPLPSLSRWCRADRHRRTYRPPRRRASCLSIRWAHPDPLRDRLRAVSAKETPGSAWDRCAYRLFLLPVAYCSPFFFNLSLP